MKQYLDLCQRIIDEGQWVNNKRTGTRCLTLINADLEYDVENNVFPLITTRKSYYKAAIAELLGYLRGYSSAAQFRAIGCNTWNANANENEAWLNSPHRSGEDDMGRVYGVQGREWRRPDGRPLDQLKKIVDNLSQGIDDRGEILSFYNPGEFEMGCLRPCMHTHTFSLLGDTLYLTSYQRSCDVPLGLGFLYTVKTDTDKKINKLSLWNIYKNMKNLSSNLVGIVTHNINRCMKGVQFS
jgi:thymidylate synthase